MSFFQEMFIGIQEDLDKLTLYQRSTPSQIFKTPNFQNLSPLNEFVCKSDCVCYECFLDYQAKYESDLDSQIKDEM